VVVVSTIPWIMMNKDTGVRFDRRQSWILLCHFFHGIKVIFVAKPFQLTLGIHGGWLFLHLPNRCLPIYTWYVTLAEVWREKVRPAARKAWSGVSSLGRILPVINMACIIWSIVAIELMIRWNDITDVHTVQSVGQLIPFVIGIVGFVKLLRDINVDIIQQYLYDEIMVSKFIMEQQKWQFHR